MSDMQRNGGHSWTRRTRRLTAGILGSLLVLAVLFRSLSPLPDGEGRLDRVVLQLNALEFAIKEEQALDRMAATYPEGACFLATLYGLTWANVAEYSHDDSEIVERAMVCVREALALQESPAATTPFSDTEVRRGVFWLGQRNLLLGRYLELVAADERDAELEQEFHRNSADLATAISASPIAHLTTYPQVCWPTDNIAALVSLAAHDRLYGARYADVRRTWRAWTEAHVDPLLGLPPARIDVASGAAVEPPRGCATAWTLALLPEIAPDLSQLLYRRFREQLGIQRFGYRVFREYPEGYSGTADVDSGPIIWNAGVAATGIGFAAARANGDLRTASDIYTLAVLIGLPIARPCGERRCLTHLFGRTTMGDAFLAYGLSLPVSAQHLSETPAWLQRFFARWMVHVPLVALLVFLVVRLRQARNRLREEG